MQRSQRLSQMLFVTLREDPAEAELISHKLLLRGGFIRRLSPGIYTYLPLLWRVLQKISDIVREEMNAIGAQECLLPQLQPAEIWRESGRWDVYTQAEGIMFALKDRQGREQALGPTHEEVITLLARDLIRSYRQLPQILYQIQTKFRDEIRPRFGLLRGREFLMKDAYSFHANEESLRQTYQDMYRAYGRILRRCGLEFRVVEADAGAIGGPSAASQEFMVLASAGEDEILYTPDGSYAANVEKAVSLPPPAADSPYTTFQVLDTPGTETIEKPFPRQEERYERRWGRAPPQGQGDGIQGPVAAARAQRRLVEGGGSTVGRLAAGAGLGSGLPALAAASGRVEAAAGCGSWAAGRAGGSTCRRGGPINSRLPPAAPFSEESWSGRCGEGLEELASPAAACC